MTKRLIPGKKGTPLPETVIVVRLAEPSKDRKANFLHFTPSDSDRASGSISVWAKELTPAVVARSLMERNPASYELALHLNVDDIREINVQENPPDPPFDIVWEPLEKPNAEGHSGITGIVRPDHVPKSKYRTLRTKLAQLARVEELPEYQGE